MAGRGAARVVGRAPGQHRAPVHEAEDRLQRPLRSRPQHVGVEDQVRVLGGQAAEAAEDLVAHHPVLLGHELGEKERARLLGREAADGAGHVAPDLVRKVLIGHRLLEGEEGGLADRDQRRARLGAEGGRGQHRQQGGHEGGQPEHAHRRRRLHLHVFVRVLGQAQQERPRRPAPPRAGRGWPPPARSGRRPSGSS